MAFSFTIKTQDLDQTILTSLTTTGSANPIDPPGLIVKSKDGREFQYVQHDSSGVAAVAGAPCAIGQTTTDNAFVVTADVSDGGSVAYGIFLSVLADTYWGWVQTKGFAVDAPSTDGSGANVAAGDPLYATDGLWAKATVGTNHVKAIGVMAGSGGYGNIVLI
jgi:hypothetical protein